MKMYHATTKEAWKAIQGEGVLWGRKDQYWMGNKMHRINWLATSRASVEEYRLGGGRCLPIVLEVDVPGVEPPAVIESGFWEDHWEYVTYDPIPLSRLRRI